MQTTTTILRTLPVKVDLLLLTGALSKYKNSAKKVSDLVKAGALHRLLRGHYLNLCSDEYPSSTREALANAIYFPSYISLEWALQYYGLITDRVHTVTSVTIRRGALFTTPRGTFSYEHLNKHKYPFAYSLRKGDGQEIFIASPVKALLDYLQLRHQHIKAENFKEFLEEDLRLDLEALLELSEQASLEELLPFYHRNSAGARLLRYLLSEKEKKHGEPS